MLVDRRPIRLPVPVHDPVGVLLSRAHSRRGPPSVVLAPALPGDRPAGPGPATETDTMTSPTTARPRLRALGVGALLSALLTVLLASPASAHDALVGSDPAEGSPLATTPARVTLTFAETPQPGLTTLTVLGPGGTRWERGEVTVDGSRVSIAVAPLGPAGPYEIGYRVVSDDGHPVAGSVAFILTAPGPGVAPAAPSSPAAPGPSPVASSSPSTPPDGGGVPTWAIVLVAVVVVAGTVTVVARRRT